MGVGVVVVSGTLINRYKLYMLEMRKWHSVVPYYGDEEEEAVY